MVATLEAFTPILAAVVEPSINSDASSVLNAKYGAVLPELALPIDGIPTPQSATSTLSIFCNAGAPPGIINDSVCSPPIDLSPWCPGMPLVYLHHDGSIGA